jgi:GT2 family glycosyltransferase
MMRRTRVDIIISTYNASEFMKRCFTSLTHATVWPYKLVITDDNSPEYELRRYLQELKDAGQAEVYLHGVRRGFAGNNNWAVSRTYSPYFLLLNEDTEPQYLWLTHMMNTMRSDDKIGVVGARLLFSEHKNGHAVAGTIQHVGVARYPDGAPYHPFRGLKADYPPANVLREVNAVTGACMLVRRKCWDDVGGFDPNYSFGQFEDVSFCWHAREKGWRIFVQPRAVLFHYEHGSGVKEVQIGHDKNRELLLAEWGHLGSDEYLFK